MLGDVQFHRELDRTTQAYITTQSARQSDDKITSNQTTYSLAAAEFRAL